MKSIEKISTSSMGDAERLQSPIRQGALSEDLFLSIVNAIHSAETLDSIFKSTMALMPISLASYNHFPSLGALDYKTLGTFHGHNLPAPIERFYKGYNMKTPDPDIVTIFETGSFVWLSDLVRNSSEPNSSRISIAKRTLNLTGEALCIPLFGPRNRRGYMFLSGGMIKKENGPLLPYQIQALAQIFHSRFCLMIQSIERQVNLTKREAQVLELLTYGKTNQDIADILDLSVNTVSGYLKKIFLKLDVSDRVNASMRAQSMKSVF
jgi:DNA-binding CsgD family transcriptional regulator